MGTIDTYNNRTIALPGIGKIPTTDAAVGTGLAFLRGELEKRDPRLLEPLVNVDWPRDIVAKTGGGWSEFSSNNFVDYAGTGGSNKGIIGGQTNNIPIVQANVTKDIFKVFTWGNILKVPFVDQSKLQTIGRSLDQMLDKAIRLGYNKTIDYLVYHGWDEENIFGLVNNPQVTASLVDAGVSTKTTWKDKTADEILYDVNQVINDTWVNSEYDITGMANHILIPPAQYADIVSRKVSEAGNVSILEYLLKNNIANNQGRELAIEPSRWCIGAGTGETDRMVAYVNSDDRVNFDLPVPLSRAMTNPDVKELSYLTAYVAQISQVKILYYQCFRYRDGI
jgi:hypothetical protein